MHKCKQQNLIWRVCHYNDLNCDSCGLSTIEAGRNICLPGLAERGLRVAGGLDDVELGQLAAQDALRFAPVFLVSDLGACMRVYAQFCKILDPFLQVEDRGCHACHLQI